MAKYAIWGTTRSKVLGKVRALEVELEGLVADLQKTNTNTYLLDDLIFVLDWLDGVEGRLTEEGDGRTRRERPAPKPTFAKVRDYRKVDGAGQPVVRPRRSHKIGKRKEE